MSVPHVAATRPDPVEEMIRWLDAQKPDTILTWEVPGSWQFPPLWESRRIRWVHVVHWDWFYPDKMRFWKSAHILIAPNAQCREKLKGYGLEAVQLPIPLDTGRFPYRERRTVETFVSVAGYGGSNGRRGLGEILAAWRLLQPAPPLVVWGQRPMAEWGIRAPAGVEFRLSDVRDPAALYDAGDAAVQTSRFEGVGLTMLEAQACGLPTITTDGPPMRDLAPFLLAPVSRVSQVGVAGKALDAYVVDPAALAGRVRGLMGSDAAGLSRLGREWVEERYSWKDLGETWIDLLSG